MVHDSPLLILKGTLGDKFTAWKLSLCSTRRIYWRGPGLDKQRLGPVT